MENSFEHIINLILSIFLIFLFPLLIINQHRDLLVQTQVEENVNAFVDNISIKACISNNMYEDLSININKLSPYYKIIIEHEEKHYYPDYQLNEDPAIGEELYKVQMLSSHTDIILNEIYENNNPYYMKQGDYINVKLINEEGFTIYKNKQIVRGGN